jgi:high-affinity iron transporter
MTHPDNQTKGSAKKEYLILVLLILIGTPIAWWQGTKDGKALAAKAYVQDDAAETGAHEQAEEAAGADDEVPASTPEAVARGEAVFKAQCIACHGEKADGKGPAAVAFTPGPRNFTDPAAKWTVGRSPTQIHQTVSKGIAGTGMAGFAAALTPEQLWDVTHYIGSLPGVAGATTP